MSVDTPERIWVTGSFSQGQYAHGSWNASNRYNPKADYGGVEYVRADNLEELAAHSRLQAEDIMTLCQMVCKAETALAEAKRENEALRERLEEYHARGFGLRRRVVDYLNSDYPKSSLRNGFTEWESASGTRFTQSPEARNAGGKDGE